MKKILVLFMVFSLLLTSAFAGGSSESTASDAAKEVTAEDLAGITLEFWHAQTGENGVAMDKVVALFNETNEYGITVNATCQGGYNDCHNKVLSALSAGTAPNISQAYNNNMMSYMPSGKLMDLTDYLTDGFGITAEELAQVVPSYLEENKAFPDGRTYATSLGKSTEVMFYNKTFFDEHGLEVPTTYEELADVAKQISQITGRPSVGFDSMDNLGIYGPINFGARYADTQGNLYIFDDENIDATMDFYRWWQKGISEGYFRTAGEDQYCSGPFSNGTIIAYIGSSSGTSYIQPDGFECAVTYAPVGVNPAVIQQGGNFCGFTTGDAAVDLATSIFLEYMYDAEASGLYAANTGYAPSSKAGTQTEAYRQSIAKGGIAAEAKDISATYPDGVLAYDPVFENSYETRLALSDIVEAIALDDDADIDALIAQAERTIAAL